MNEMNEDAEHLRLLSLCHYVFGALVAVGALFPGIYVVFGIFMITGADFFGEEKPPAFFGWLMIGFGLLFLLLILAYAAALLWAGRSLAQRRGWTFCVVVAALSCTVMPFGTVLGVFTLIVLSRPSVRPLFAGEAPLQASPLMAS